MVGRGVDCVARVSLNIRREDCVVKLRLRDNEGINDAVKRFRKLVEHAGIKKEMRRREFYEKPSETRRRARRRAERRSRIQRQSAAFDLQPEGRAKLHRGQTTLRLEFHPKYSLRAKPVAPSFGDLPNSSSTWPTIRR